MTCPTSEVVVRIWDDSPPTVTVSATPATAIVKSTVVTVPTCTGTPLLTREVKPVSSTVTS
jgi:hypothetical protein